MPGARPLMRPQRNDGGLGGRNLVLTTARHSWRRPYLGICSDAVHSVLLSPGLAPGLFLRSARHWAVRNQIHERELEWWRGDWNRSALHPPRLLGDNLAPLSGAFFSVSRFCAPLLWEHDA